MAGQRLGTGTDPKLAQTMVARMSELLRRILSAGATQFVSLRRELDLLEHYLDFQQLRFPSRLSHEFRLDTAAPTALLPALILQPLMENAVVHSLRDESSRLPDDMPFVIFVTASDSYAATAFDLAAVDYLLQPCTPKRFAQAVGAGLKPTDCCSGSTENPGEILPNPSSVWSK